jgi:hypothetical protein
MLGGFGQPKDCGCNSDCGCVGYKTQVVAGLNYKIKLENGLHVKLHRPLPSQGNVSGDQCDIAREMMKVKTDGLSQEQIKPEVLKIAAEIKGKYGWEFQDFESGKLKGDDL